MEGFRAVEKGLAYVIQHRIGPCTCLSSTSRTALHKTNALDAFDGTRSFILCSTNHPPQYHQYDCTDLFQYWAPHCPPRNLSPPHVHVGGITMAPPTPAAASRHTVKHEALVQKSHVRGATPSAVDVGAFVPEAAKSDLEVSFESQGG